MATVSIEASKECQVFARRTAELSALVKEGYPGASIVVNAERPRKGHFEVRVGEKVILTLAGMPRPFKRLRETELSEVIHELDVFLSCDVLHIASLDRRSQLQLSPPFGVAAMRRKPQSPHRRRLQAPPRRPRRRLPRRPRKPRLLQRASLRRASLQLPHLRPRSPAASVRGPNHLRCVDG